MFDSCHYSRVTAVDRNPFYPKNFLTIGDHTAKIWCEDLRTSAIMWMKPSAARLTGGGWNPARMSVFHTTRVDGVLEVWKVFGNCGLKLTLFRFGISCTSRVGLLYL